MENGFDVKIHILRPSSNAAYNKRYTSLRPDSLLESSARLKLIALALPHVQKILHMTPDSKKLFTVSGMYLLYNQQDAFWTMDEGERTDVLKCICSYTCARADIPLSV